MQSFQVDTIADHCAPTIIESEPSLESPTRHNLRVHWKYLRIRKQADTRHLRAVHGGARVLLLERLQRARRLLQIPNLVGGLGGRQLARRAQVVEAVGLR